MDPIDKYFEYFKNPRKLSVKLLLFHTKCMYLASVQMQETVFADNRFFHECLSRFYSFWEHLTNRLKDLKYFGQYSSMNLLIEKQVTLYSWHLI